MRVSVRIAMLGVGAFLATSGVACKQNRAWMANDLASGGAAGYRIDSNVAGVLPGIHPVTEYGPMRNPYANSAAARVQGRQLFVAYNCAGCHGGHAGGGMGPSLRDSVWKYGSSDTQIFATIMEGRPLGMPAWGARIPEPQIWQLVSYIKSLRTPEEPDPPRPASKPQSATGKTAE
ncbi:MAG TPA: c-type cytochrome [Gemmatimonadaceae bacterium]|jgi:cytochrome c oxidase cbb3-type subunit 3|nr:c-type cytochrome [Gemmatimonadaceae bacterium]